MDERSRISDLVAIARDFDLDALRVRVDGRTYELRLREPNVAPPPAAAASPSPAPAALGEPSRGLVPSASMRPVAAPIIGVFYRSAAPGSAPFVDLGDRVAVGQVLCILEAMKLMNEITSDHAGVVTRILPENGALVSLGEEMFWIEP
ncbi:MAG: biotin/lipoyl-containing protein [Candidatus Baltobacteraceae bacterium]